MMRPRSRKRPLRIFSQTLIFVGLLALVSARPAVAQAGTSGTEPTARPAEPLIRLEARGLPAAGRQETRLHVTRFGRYALTVQSAQGVAVQLVDRMAGPGAVAGVAGSEDGRLDVFLDRGEYQLLTFGPENAEGEAKLEARIFTEAAGEGEAPRLVPYKLVETSLGDVETRSYWLLIEDEQTVALEAAGRFLRDLRLWRDGQWLVDAAPEVAVVDPRPGEPLLTCRLAVRLEPGLYRLSAYGGVPQPWAAGGAAEPLYLRWGIPSLPEAGRRRFEVSPFGIDRWRIPDANFYRLELPAPKSAVLQVVNLNEDRPFQEGGRRAQISKESVPPVVEVELASATERVVTVSAEAGQPYVLQHFLRRESYGFRGGATFWLSTLHSGTAADSADTTALVVRTPRGSSPQREPFVAQVVEVGPRTTYARRFNLLGDVTLFVHVEAAGEYRVTNRGTAAEFRLEPFLISRPQGYEPPPFRVTDLEWSLDPGYYVLTLKPRQKGVADFVLGPVGGPTPAPQPPKGAAVFEALSLVGEDTYTLYLNQRPEVKSGVILRPLPLDLRQALPTVQDPGQELRVPFELPGEAGPGVLTAVAEDGTALEISLDEGPFQPRHRVTPGRHMARVRLPQGAEGPVHYSLELVPEAQLAETPLPPLPEGALDALPDFPVLTAREPRFLDLDRGSRATFQVRADEPALYRLESQGLLATEGNLRSRVVPSLDRQQENGVGRNFLVQQYLREGDYQLTVATLGQSRGHLGVSLSRTPLPDGGELTPGVAARTTLAAGEGVLYRFQVMEAGTYRLRALGLRQEFRVRVEDGEGWPVVAPNQEGDLTLFLRPGDYRLVVLPPAVESRAVTLLEKVPEPLRFEGHGPHELPLGRTVEHLWLEPPDAGAVRTPDAWLFRLPAQATAAIQLSPEMRGQVFQADGQPGGVVGEVAGGSWSRPLPQGEYRLEVTSARPDNRRPYTVRVSTVELVAGSERPLTAGATPLNVGDPEGEGQGQLLEIRSFGQVDARARLFSLDPQGEERRLVAESDDVAGDWNFRLVQRLAPGPYLLEVDTQGDAAGDEAGDETGEAAAALTVHVEALQERLVEALRPSPAAERQLRLERDVLLLPLDKLPRAGRLLVAGARSAQALGLSLEQREGGVWRPVVTRTGSDPSLAAVLGSGDEKAKAASYRLRLWSLDRRPGDVRLAVAAAAPAAVDEARLASGARLDAVAGSGMAALRVDLVRPGVFDVAESEGLLVCTPPSGLQATACRAPEGLVAALGEALYVVRPEGRSEVPGRSEVSGRRVTLAAGASLRLAPPAGAKARVDLAPPASGGGGPQALLATSRVGLPGVGFGEGAHAGLAQAAAGGDALAVSLEPAADARVWWAGEAATARDLDLRALAFRAVPPEAGGWGSFEGGLAGVAARVFDLPAGDKRLRLSLGADLVAVLSAPDGAIESVHWHGGGAFEETVDAAAARLTLLHLGEGAHRFAVEVLPSAAAPPAVVSPDAPFERLTTRSGWLRLAVTAPAVPATLKVGPEAGGDEAPAEWIAADGRRARGSTIALQPGETGVLHLPHEPGLVLAWLAPVASETGEELERRHWFGESPPTRRPVSLPSVVDLEGASLALAVELAEPSMVSLRTEAPAVALVAGELSLHPRGVVLDAFLPAGASQLWLRSLGDVPLAGLAELTRTPVTPLGEGLGPEVLLAAGATRLFSFTVERPGPVGLGVRADSDVVAVTLLDAVGRQLGEGYVQMPTLEPGTYLLGLTAPRDSRPVRVRPALLGVEPPGTGPPPEVIREYLEEAGVVTPAEEPTDEPNPVRGEG